MPKIQCKNKNIYYEIHGEGEPLLLLNGIMMSTYSWTLFKEVFSKRYQLILLDLVDQGQSDKMEGEPFYTQDYHVEILQEFIQKLNFKKIHLFGISYGAEVAIKFAIANDSILSSLILANVPFKTNERLRYIAKRWKDVFKSYDGLAMFRETNQFIYAESFYEKKATWLEEKEKLFNKILPKEWYDGMLRLLDSGDNYDPENDLHKINVNTLIIGGGEDLITPVKYQQEVAKRIKNSSLIIIEGTGHGLPYENPLAFSAAVLGFLEVCQFEFKTI